MKTTMLTQQKAIAAAEMRKIATCILDDTAVEPEALALLAAAYLKMDQEIEGRRARAKLRGGRLSPPVNPDGRLVLKALKHMERSFKLPCTLGDLATFCGSQRSQLSRCNHKTTPTPLPESVTTILTNMIAAKSPDALLRLRAVAK